jgi:Acetyltransferase (GNAT) domain
MKEHPSAAPDIVIRAYSDDDAASVIDLLRATLGEGPTGDRSEAFFRWKHRENPFGESLMLVAESEGQILGLRAFMRWRFRSRGGLVEGLRAVDTATALAAQGRGIFSRLTAEALTIGSGVADLIFNTPNDQSLPGYLKLGWCPVGNVPIRLRVAKPLRFALGARTARHAGATPSRPRPRVEAPRADQAFPSRGVQDLLAAGEQATDALSTDRSVSYLRWRYASAPLDYHAIERTSEGGGLHGLVFFRVRPRGRLWEATVGDVIVRAGDVDTARSLLRAVARATHVDHLAMSFPATSAPGVAARRGLGVAAPGGMTLVTKPLRALALDAQRLDSWALTLGDLEVF